MYVAVAMLRLLVPLATVVATCGPAPAQQPAPSDGARTQSTAATPRSAGGQSYVPDRVCLASSPSGEPALTVQGCACAEALQCHAQVSGHAIAITARTSGVVTCSECTPLEGVCELGRLSTDVKMAIEVEGKPIGELRTDAAGSFAAGPCYDASPPGPG